MKGLSHAILPVAALALLSSCGGGTGGNGTVAGSAGASDWIVGAWVDNVISCDGDTATSYHKDGTYTGYDENGSWSLSGSILKMTTLTTYTMGEDEPEKKVENPVAVQIEVVSHDDSHAKFRYSDGKTMDLVKCPST